MSKKRDDTVYLQHILEATGRIHRYINDLDEDAFKQDTLRQDGVIRQLEVIGEAVKQLSEQLRSEHDAVPWSDLAGMRDKLIHHYFGVDLEAVWLASSEDVPVLHRQIKKILSSIEDS